MRRMTIRPALRPGCRIPIKSIFQRRSCRSRANAEASRLAAHAGRAQFAPHPHAQGVRHRQSLWALEDVRGVMEQEGWAPATWDKMPSSINQR